MGEAYAIAAGCMEAESRRICGLRERLWRAIEAAGGMVLNGHPTQRAAGILSVTVDGCEGECLLHALADLALSSGSACATTSAEPSYVLRALGRSDRLAQSTLRLSLGRFTTDGEVDYAARRVVEEVVRLRGIAPAPRGPTP
jgi:cysteine desulfurase